MPMGEEDFDDDIIFPIMDLEHHDGGDEGTSDDDSEDNVSGRYAKKKVKEFKPLMSRRQMRRSKLGFTVQDQFTKLNINQDHEEEEEKKPSVVKMSSMSAGKSNWMKAFKKIKKLEDPWAKFHIDDFPSEKCTRHRYNALKRKWVQDTVTVKMETEVNMCLYARYIHVE